MVGKRHFISASVSQLGLGLSCLCSFDLVLIVHNHIHRNLSISSRFSRFEENKSFQNTPPNILRILLACTLKSQFPFLILFIWVFSLILLLILLNDLSVANLDFFGGREGFCFAFFFFLTEPTPLFQ